MSGSDFNETSRNVSVIALTIFARLRMVDVAGELTHLRIVPHRTDASTGSEKPQFHDLSSSNRCERHSPGADAIDLTRKLVFRDYVWSEK